MREGRETQTIYTKPSKCCWVFGGKVAGMPGPDHHNERHEELLKTPPGLLYRTTVQFKATYDVKRDGVVS